MKKAKIIIGAGNHNTPVSEQHPWQTPSQDSSFEPPYPRELLALPPKDPSSVKELMMRLKARLGWLF